MNFFNKKTIFFLWGLVFICGFLLFLNFKRDEEIERQEEVYSTSIEGVGSDVYHNYRQGIYACYNSLTSKYRGVYNTHDFLNGGQYNIYWSYYEPSEGNFDWNKSGALKAELDSAKETGLKTFLQIDAYGWGNDGGALPKWMDSKVKVIDITGKDSTSEYIFWNRFPAPWDSAYHNKLRIFLTGLKNKLIQENAISYIAGIEMGTGPMAQTSFSWNSIKDELVKQSGTSNIQGFCSKYNDGLKDVIDIYAEIFEDTDIPLILIGGNCYGTGEFNDFKQYAFSKYGLRMKYKMAGFGGWGTDSSCGRRPEYKTICDVDNCPSSYLGENGQCPVGFCSQESGTIYSKWACKNYSSVFNSSIKEDNLSTTCLYADDFKSGNSGNFSLIRDFASKLGSKVSFVSSNIATNFKSGENSQASISWKNEGSTSLVWPRRITNSDGSQKEIATSYKIMIVFNKKDSNEKYVQYIDPNPGTNTSSWKQSQVKTSFNINVPGLKQGTYDVYVALVPNLSQEDIDVGKKMFGFALWNSGNWGKDNDTWGDNMYLIKSNVSVSGNDNRTKQDLPFGNSNYRSRDFIVKPITTPIPTSTPTPISTPTPTPTVDCYTCNDQYQCVLDAGCQMNGPRCNSEQSCPTPTPYNNQGNCGCVEVNSNDYLVTYECRGNDNRDYIFWFEYNGEKISSDIRVKKDKIWRLSSPRIEELEIRCE